jgi:cobalt-zinc-cadmium efflux system membrane fusion protein
MPAPLKHRWNVLRPRSFAPLALLPTFATLGVLVAVGVVGHLTDWKPSRIPELWGADPAAPDTAAKEGETNKVAGDPLVIHFVSREALDLSGIKSEPVGTRPMTQFVIANGSIDYNRTRLAQLSTRAAGHVYQVFKRTGDHVDRDQVLGLVDAADVGRAKADFLQALRTFELRSQVFERERQSAASLPERRLQESEAAVAEASIRLFNAQQALANFGLPVDHEQLKGLPDKQLTDRVRFLGLKPDVIRQLRPGTTTADLIPLIAPFAASVIRADLVRGELVNSNTPQFTVADMHRLWLILDVRQEDMGLVHKKQHMSFRPDGTDAEAEGRVSWIGTEVDARTRTVRVRAEVDNPDGRLRVHSFGSGRIRVAHKDNAVAVPAGAVQWVPHQWVLENMTRSMAPAADQEGAAGTDPVVFVRDADDGLSFTARLVQLGIREGGFVEVVAGVRASESIATAATHVLRSELMRGDIGSEGD